MPTYEQLKDVVPDPESKKDSSRDNTTEDSNDSSDLDATVRPRMVDYQTGVMNPLDKQTAAKTPEGSDAKSTEDTPVEIKYTPSGRPQMTIGADSIPDTPETKTPVPGLSTAPQAEAEIKSAETTKLAGVGTPETITGSAVSKAPLPVAESTMKEIAGKESGTPISDRAYYGITTFTPDDLRNFMVNIGRESMDRAREQLRDELQDILEKRQRALTQPSTAPGSSQEIPKESSPKERKTSQGAIPKQVPSTQALDTTSQIASSEKGGTKVSKGPVLQVVKVPSAPPTGQSSVLHAPPEGTTWEEVVRAESFAKLKDARLERKEF